MESKYMVTLQRWIAGSRKDLYSPPARPDLTCYGTGYNDWGVQTNQKAFAAYAVMASSLTYDEKEAGMTKDEVLNYALQMLRFTMESHITGNASCTDGTSWGNTWISALGTERMMHAVEAIEHHLTNSDKEKLRRMLLSECEWLMDNYEIEAGPVDHNKPESNIWNGSLLHRCAVMYPDHTRADEFREKGTRFLINGISIENDAASNDIVDGLPVSQRFIGGNFFNSFALNHHEYLNVGYMVICLSNVAMLHFMYKKAKITPPQSLYQHVKPLWELVKQLTFPDGRLMRIGGDTRVRYCYCQDYCIPVWLFIRDYLGEDCAEFEKSWLQLVDTEMKANGDGTFLSQRCDVLKEMSPQYYTRLESDRAVSLSMGAYWHKLIRKCDTSEAVKPIKTLEVQQDFSWKDDYHGACFQKGKNRAVSWVWEAAEGPQGMSLPNNRSDMAEWKFNLSGAVNGVGNVQDHEIIAHQEYMFDGGFLTSGTLRTYSDVFMSEGQRREIIAEKKIAFAALPDDCSTVVIQYAISPQRCFLRDVKGLHLLIPNDMYNGNVRSYVTNQREMNIRGYGAAYEILTLNSNWLNIDECLGIYSVYGGESLQLLRPGQRQVGLKPYRGRYNIEGAGMLYADEIGLPIQSGLQSIDAGQVLFDIGAVLQTNISHGQTKASSEKDSLNQPVSSHPDIRLVMVTGKNDVHYLVVFNIGVSSVETDLCLSFGTSLHSLCDSTAIKINNERVKLKLPVDGSQVYVVD